MKLEKKYIYIVPLITLHTHTKSFLCSLLWRGLGAGGGGGGGGGGGSWWGT